MVVCNAHISLVPDEQSYIVTLTAIIYRYIAPVMLDDGEGGKVQATSKTAKKGHVARLVLCEACSWYYGGSSQFCQMQETVQNMKRHCGFSGYDAAGDPLFEDACGKRHREALVKYKDHHLLGIRGVHLPASAFSLTSFIATL
jgi:hypothetical protein